MQELTGKEVVKKITKKGKGRARKRRRNTTEQCREVDLARARERRRNNT